MKTIKCNVAQSGIFAGPVLVMISTGMDNISNASTVDAAHELQAFENAVAQIKEELSTSDLGPTGKEIISALSTFLDDKPFIGGICQNIVKNGCSAADAVKMQTIIMLEKINSSGSEYLKERQSDIRGIANRLIQYLSGDYIAENYSEPMAIASEEISPVLLTSSDSKYIGALVSDKGSPNSHAAIIAGSLGIPYLYGAGEVIPQLTTGQKIIVDGNSGVLILDPDDDTYNDAISQMVKASSKRISFSKSEDLTCRTKIYANISSPDDIPAVLEADADGIGLFRTEFLFLSSDKAPSEEEQYKIYSKVLEAMGDKEVVIRTMDIGSDKSVGWLGLSQEINPALGLRGIRVSLEHQELLLCQLRALLRASVNGNLKVMAPMIASEWEVDELIHAVNEVDIALTQEGIEHSVPDIGIMIETPAAAVTADILAEKVSFFSIGTNDLTQYTLAIDREAAGMDKYFNPHHEAVLRLIEMTAEKAHSKGIPVGICGQLAAHSDIIDRLIKCGIDELSVPVSMVNATRKNAHEAELKLAADIKCSKAVNDGLIISAVADGELIPMNEIPDAAFAEGSLGPCIGILPTDKTVYSPCSGTVTAIAKTKHAITVKSDSGVSYLVHIGIDTVKLNGKGFSVLVNEGQQVQCGDPIAEADLDVIRSEGLSPMVITVKLDE